MINFNILPPAEKKEINDGQKIKILSIWGGTIFLLMCLAFLLLIPSYFLLALQRDEILRNLEITENGPQVKRSDEIRRALVDLRASADDLKVITQSSGVFSRILSDLLKAMPAGVTMTSIRFDGTTQELSFDGMAKTRALLVEMEAALKNTERMKDVAVPLTSLVLNADIPFTIKVKVTQ